jgi:hypothetical protein
MRERTQRGPVLGIETLIPVLVAHSVPPGGRARHLRKDASIADHPSRWRTASLARQRNALETEPATERRELRAQRLR